MTELYVDGGCAGNDQRDIQRRQMVSVVTNANGDVIVEDTRPGGSNNLAELLAVRDAVRWCRANGIHAALVRTDSKNNLAWVDGKKVGKRLNDRETVMAVRAEILAARKAGFVLTLEWIPRDQNLAGHHIESRYAL